MSCVVSCRVSVCTLCSGTIGMREQRSQRLVVMVVSSWHHSWALEGPFLVVAYQSIHQCSSDDTEMHLCILH